MTFEEWWTKQEDYLYDLDPTDIASHTWQAAQAAERERAKALVEALAQVAGRFDGTKPDCEVAAAAYRMFKIAKQAIAKYEGGR